MKKNQSGEAIPDLQIQVFLVPYGYQVDFADSKTMQGASICRDFGGDYKIDDIKKAIVEEIADFFKSRLEKKLIKRER